ncbi:MAG: sigma factor-like helix-turn-helix DNA-binding protein [Myxococcota bacterium]
MAPPWAGPRGRFLAVASCWTPPQAATCTDITCRYHLAHRRLGEHQVTPTRDCALVVANEGEHSVEEVAAAFGMTPERVRQLERSAIRKLQRSDALGAPA